MGFRRDFLWGGAVAAHQLEGGYNKGGKGLSIMDVTTAGNVNTKRRVTDFIVEGEDYPNHEAIDFYSRFFYNKRVYQMNVKTKRKKEIWHGTENCL